MEKKLEAYRRYKRKEGIITEIKQFYTKILPWSKQDSIRNITEDLTNLDDIKYKSINEDNQYSNPTIKFIIYLLYFLLWAILYLIAIQVEFGAVYFIISSLFLIWINTRTNPKKPGEISAYSVFNPNCEAIDGTLKAEQFEREIRYGALNVH